MFRYIHTQPLVDCILLFPHIRNRQFSARYLANFSCVPPGFTGISRSCVRCVIPTPVGLTMGPQWVPTTFPMHSIWVPPIRFFRSPMRGRVHTPSALFVYHVIARYYSVRPLKRSFCVFLHFLQRVTGEKAHAVKQSECTVNVRKNMQGTLGTA